MAEKKEKEKKKYTPKEALGYFNLIRSSEGAITEDPHSYEVRDSLAKLEGKDPLDYAKLKVGGVKRKLDAHMAKARKVVKDNLTYSWLLQNESTEELLKYLPVLPELKDKDSFKTLVETSKEYMKALATGHTTEGREVYIRTYYDKQIKDLEKKGEKEEANLMYADLYAAVGNTESTDAAYGGVIAALQYEMKREIEKYAPKKKEKK